MLGSTQIGAEQMTALARDLGPSTGCATSTASSTTPTAACAPPSPSFPTGSIVGAEMTDNDCFVECEIWIRVTITKSGDSLRVDYTGTDPQMKGFKNSSISNTRSATYVALTSFLDPEIPRNDGTYRCVDDRRAARHRRQSAPAGAR